MSAWLERVQGICGEVDGADPRVSALFLPRWRSPLPCPGTPDAGTPRCPNSAVPAGTLKNPSERDKERQTGIQVSGVALTPPFLPALQFALPDLAVHTPVTCALGFS
jgi:hypothetical protein